MHDLTPFEQELSARLQAEARHVADDFDPAAIARSAMVRRGARDRLANLFAGGYALPMQPASRAAVLGLIALLVLATMAVAIGMQRPGGRPLAYIRAPGDVIVANADGSDPRVIGHVEMSPLRNVVSWAPGGRHLATFAEGWRLVITDPSGNVTFSRQLDDRSSQFAWSADGHHLAVLDGAWIHDSSGFGAVVDPHLFIVSADGTVEATTDLPDAYRYTVGQGAIAWSRDGTQLAITGFDATSAPAATSSAIWIVDRATLEAREILPPGPLEYDINPVWLPDGRILFSRENGGIWQVDASTEAEAQVFAPACPPCTGHTIVPFVPSPDARRLALYAPNDGLAVLDLQSGVVAEVPVPDGLGIAGGMGWTQDARGLTLVVGSSSDKPFYADDLAIVDIATGATRVIAPDILAYDLRPS